MHRPALFRIHHIPVPHSTIWLLESCAAAKATFAPAMAMPQSLFAPVKRQARIESTESSNRIEGVTVDGLRMVPLVLGDARPLDRSEEEIRGYSRSLEWILSGRAEPPLTPGLIKTIHHRTFRGRLASDPGEFKTRNNDILEIDGLGNRRVVFQTVDWRECMALLDRLCLEFHRGWDAPGLSDLLVLATFLCDFLCIHPFRDGNGRTSRLLTTLLLKWTGWQVMEYVSLERLIEEDKDGYYRALREAQQGWHEGQSNPAPWWNYFLGILRRAHEDAARLVDAVAAVPVPQIDPGSMGATVRARVLAMDGPFKLTDLVSQSPGSSEALVRKTLQQMKSAGEVMLKGRGRGAVWRVVRRG